MNASTFSLAWESALVARIADESDRVLVSESISAARNGAFRLAIIGAWLAAAESLKRRFVELSQIDSEAGKVLSRIREREETQKAVDRTLLERAHAYGMTSVAENSALEHLMDTRNIFAHPYTEQPTEEDVRAAIVSVVEHLLEKPLLLRHRFIADETARILTREGWIGDSREAVNQRIDVMFRRVDPGVLPSFVPILVRQIEPTFDDLGTWDGVLGRRIQWVIEEFLDQADPTLTDGIAAQDLLSSFPRGATLAMSHHTIFDKLEGHVRDSTIGELCALAAGLGVHFGVTMNLVRRGALTESELARVVQSLSGTDLSSLANAGTPLELYVDRLITLLASHDWYQQNPAVLALRSAGAEKISQLSSSDQEELGRNVLQSADGSAKESERLLATVSADPDSWPDDFLYGLVIECLANEQGRFRLKKDFLRSALRALSGLPATRRLAIIGRLVAAVAESESSPFESTAAAVEEVQSQLGEEGADLAKLVVERDSMDFDLS